MELVQYNSLVFSTASVILGFIAAFVKTRTFVDFLELRVLNGAPKKISKDDLNLINGYFDNDEIHVMNIIREQPELSFLPYQALSNIETAINDSKAKAKMFHHEQIKSGNPDDPHAFVYESTPIEILQSHEHQELLTYVIPRYSQLRALPKEERHRLLVLGANNLVIHSSRAEFIFHKRGDTAETQSGKLHGFGGGYMPYWESGEKTISVRRDDCKNLRYTAMRELHEESGLLSLAHIPGIVVAINERHTKHQDSDGKFGYITFFFITLVSKHFRTAFKGDSKEGSRQVIPINKKNLRSMIISRKFQGLEIHPQLRAMLTVWFFSGCPGLHYFRRLWLSNLITKRSLRAALS